ncbi:VWA domain-containing protein [Micrococcus sp. FDAARGOS_333]|uniref:VWA domain-containing protein n=1 Tax=Micrococcus sp. FDAARGOS_333 TaxID=1930558 RepID=UPI00187D3E4D|nr:VWA domain-containing protein [Micrococcus sp. FDAARGOS_333]
MDRIHRRITAAATGALLSAAVLAPPSALAEQKDDDGARTTQQPVVVVMDYSESMLEKDADEKGTARINAAKTATRELVEKTPEGAQLGMVAFGHADRNTCTKIETLQEVSEVDKDALMEKVDALDAQGGTPIGKSLQQAADELKGVEDEKSIILVSDGEPTCDEPPACEVAQQLADDGIDLTVHTIGFRLEGNAKAQETLECIAEATGGTYSDAEDADQLTSQLTRRALEAYTAEGTPVQGGDGVRSAAALTPGQFVDSLPTRAWLEHPTREEMASETFEDVRFYRVPFREGYTPVVSATLATPVEHLRTGEGYGLAVRPVPARPDAEGNCFPDGMDGGRQWTIQNTGAANPHLTSLWSDREEMKALSEDEALREECLVDGEDLVVAVYRMEDGEGGPEDVPLELTVGYEPTVESSGGGAELPPPSFTLPERTEAADLPGGLSFGRAEDIESGKTVKGTLLPGERRYYAIDVQAGQTLTVREDLPGDSQRAGGTQVSVFNPLREEMPFATEVEPADEDFSLDLGLYPKDGGAMQASVLAGPIDPELRSTLDPGREHFPLSVPGRQYIVVAREFQEQAGGELPFELTAVVDGEPQETDPQGAMVLTAAQWDERFGAEDESSADTDGSSAGEGSSAGSTEGSAEETSRDGSPAEDAGAESDGQDGSEPSDDAEEDAPDTSVDATPESAAGGSSNGDGAGFLPWALGGAGVVALVGGLLLAARRRA